MANKLYNEKSIESLSPLEFTRLRPGVYCGDTTYSTQTLIEILSNSVDEHRLGHGNRIEIEINSSGAIRVRDYGQGFIVNSIREDGKTVLEAAFSVLNTSGKYREDGTYEGTSLGSFGIGSKITTYLSHWLDVYTYRDGKMEHIHFVEGEFESRDIQDTNQPSGTCVEWLPSEEFFTNIGIDITSFIKLCKVIAALCPGLTISMTMDGKTQTFFSENGLMDLVDEAVKDKELIKNRLSIKFEDGKNKLDLALTYTNNYSSTIVPYVNTGLTEAGPHITQIKTLFTREFNKFFREKGWLKEKDDNLSGEDIQEGLYVVFNITAPNVAYDAQVKSRVTKLDMKPFTAAMAEELQYWFAVNEKEVKGIADKALNARKAREAAKKAREAARETNKKEKKPLLDLPTKLVDCWSKVRSKCELYIVEGDSAANGLVKARSSEFQAIFPIRGKMISCYKNSDEKIFANAEINNLIKAIGLPLDPKRKKLIYDPKKLRYHKIIAAADADPDGKAIKNLIFTDIWWICPELLINGHIYAAVPPLYRVTTSKNQYIYLDDNKDLEEYKIKHRGKKFVISRNKGLGEQDSDELGVSLLDVETRNLRQVTVADAEEAAKMFEILMGPSVPPRREYLLAHSEEAED